jgi:hypothetical protein
MSDNREAVLRMAKRIHQGAKHNGGKLSFEQAQKISAKAIKKTESK